ncbi:hypothetical protein HYW87_00855 [Candidatus Roizmanbacteria bacterium]|nr:hypothetical protein [Candidatus Roizmanbacteria bacterium]
MTLIIILALILLLPFTVLAQTASPSATVLEPSPTASEEQKEIDTLKEKIATKVEELRKGNDRAIGGSIKTKDATKKILKIVDDKEEEFEIKIDVDLTKLYQISGTVSKEITFDSLKKDLYVISLSKKPA